MLDLIIVGGGAAGLAAGIYSARYMLDTLLISKPGGAALDAPWVENYPGFESISGMELIAKFEKQVKGLGINVVDEEVKKIIKKKNHFQIKIKNKKYESKTVILALGREKNKLNVKGEADFTGKGVSYCATCDGPLFRDKVVGVVGGANSAAKSALLLAEHAKKVYIIYRRDKLRAEPIITEKVEKNKKIEVIYKRNVKEIKGENMIRKVILDNGKELELDGLFVEIGSTPSTKFLKDLGVKLNDKGYIKVDCNQKTNVKGVFAAGDVTVGSCNKIRQIITSAAEGVLAATAAYEYLR